MRLLRITLTCLAGAAVVLIGFTRVDWTSVLSSILAARPVPVVGAGAVVLVTLVLVTVRWAALLGVSSGAPVAVRLWHSVVAAQAVNIVAPFRLGEGVRLASTSRWASLSLGRVAGALAIERIFDMVAFAVAVLALAALGVMPDVFAGSAQATLTLGALAGVVLLTAIYGMPRLIAAIRTVRPEPDTGMRRRVGRWLLGQAEESYAGWRSLSPSRLAWSGAVTVLILISSATTNLLVLRAFSLAVPWFAALVLLVVLQVGTAVVSVPGNVGVFHYLTVVTLGAWQVPADEALAAAVVLHAVSLGPKMVLGGLALAWFGGSAAWRPAASPGRPA